MIAKPPTLADRRLVALFQLPLAAAISSAPLLASVIVVVTTRDVIGDDGQFDRIVPAQVVLHKDAEPADVETLRALIDELCRPMGVEQAEAVLGELAALTVRRAHDEIADDVLASAYSARLAQYPRDVAADACSDWADGHRFWPAWAELRAACDRRVAPRQLLQQALAAPVDR